MSILAEKLNNIVREHSQKGQSRRRLSFLEPLL